MSFFTIRCPKCDTRHRLHESLADMHIYQCIKCAEFIEMDKVQWLFGDDAR